MNSARIKCSKPVLDPHYHCVRTLHTINYCFKAEDEKNNTLEQFVIQMILSAQENKISPNIYTGDYSVCK